VSGLDRKSGRLTLAVSTGGKHASYSVDLNPNAAYWFFPRDAAGLGEAVAGSLDLISSGDTLYVRGAKGASSESFVASLIISGGFRSFAATIEPTGPLDALLHVRLVLSGNSRIVHIAPGEFYVIGRAGGTGNGKRRLYQMSVADLQRGDTVLILGIDQGDGSLRACAMIAGFSPSRVLPSDPSQQMRWIFDNIALGDAYLIPADRSLPKDP
jgi:hypothetical protein